MSKIMINSILLKEHIESIGNQKYLSIKKRSAYERNKICDKFGQFHDTLELRKEVKAYEIAKNTNNIDLNSIEKLIFISNMLISDDEKFAAHLLSKNYTIEKLEMINNLLKITKKRSEEEQQKILNSQLFVEYSTFSKLYYGINNPHIVINKSNEILAKQPKLLIKK